MRCGFSDVRALQIDHKHGGGSREHDRLGCYAVYQRIAIHNITEPYQLLCANCNFIKRYEENEVPKTIQPESELNIKIKSYRKIKKGKYVYAPKELFAGNKTLAPLSFLYEQTTDHKLDKYISDEVNPAFS